MALVHLGQSVMQAGDTIDRFNATFAVPTRTDLSKGRGE
jgi:hypothetical protein